MRLGAPSALSLLLRGARRPPGCRSQPAAAAAARSPAVFFRHFSYAIPLSPNPIYCCPSAVCIHPLPRLTPRRLAPAAPSPPQQAPPLPPPPPREPLPPGRPGQHARPMHLYMSPRNPATEPGTNACTSPTLPHNVYSTCMRDGCTCVSRFGGCPDLALDDSMWMYDLDV
jgi:hypothetical protein